MDCNQDQNAIVEVVASVLAFGALWIKKLKTRKEIASHPRVNRDYERENYINKDAQKGNKPSNTFKAVSINQVAEVISKRFQVNCDAKHVENHLRTIKNQWQIICTIRDLDDGNQDSVHIDYDNEETEEVGTKISSFGTSKCKRKNAQESVVDQKIKFVGEQLGKIANALEQFTADKTPHLYEE
ncbi:hypothetical protein J1N35_013820 [Gossypium stocksii]|uniref:Myb/SANT-like domain-containing protein n=1 Tax=Gossypium stocksii TaxID=47602 RepID=A0A9D3VVU2_9ROSI|nr:hypothetical protein J1N35_013820 [Gossypium stocksii]